MATKTTKTEKALQPEPDRFKLSEAGSRGTNLWYGVSQDELKSELNYPQSRITFKQMSYHGAVNAPLRLYENIIGRTDWVVRPPENATEEEKQQTLRIREMMQDMDHTWNDFIIEVLSMNRYGFSLHEKVYRKRFSANGSKYNDGLIGWKRLPIRNQFTIDKFVYDDSGNNLRGAVQNLSGVQIPTGKIMSSGQKTLPMSKLLHFRVGNHQGDPFGKSPLRDAYLAWRYLIAIEEIEAIGVSKDLNGLPILYCPAQYLDVNANAETKAMRAVWEQALANLQANQQSSMLLPMMYDSETRQPLFKLELLTNQGSKGFDTVKIKEYYKNMIFTALFADILIMGQSSTGSFALGQVKNSLTGTAAEAMVRQIKDVLNQDLIRQTYELNGWNPSRACTLDFDNLDQVDLDILSKFLQRTASTGILTKDLDVINVIRSAIGVDNLPEGTDFEALLPESTTSAGKGMATAGPGTSKSPNGNDTSSDNLENAA
jgi:hypothetical protein